MGDLTCSEVLFEVVLHHVHFYLLIQACNIANPGEEIPTYSTAAQKVVLVLKRFSSHFWSNLRSLEEDAREHGIGQPKLKVLYNFY